jgi:hypothetical protein
MLGALASSLVVLSVGPRANAEEPDSGLGFVVGAATFVVGFGVGGAITATSADRNATQNTAGWMTMQSTFIVAPIVGHGVVHEWGRGLWFAVVPAAALGGSSAVFAVDPAAVRHAPLGEQRVLWSLFSVALVGGAVGVVDVAFAEDRARSVTLAPIVGGGTYGLEMRGLL